MQHVPKGNGRRRGLNPRRISSGVDGELRVLISVLSVATTYLWSASVYFAGRK
jgi:hypothetical protein